MSSYKNAWIYKKPRSLEMRIVFTYWILFFIVNGSIAQVSDSIYYENKMYELDSKFKLNDDLTKRICNDSEDCISSNFVYSAIFRILNDSVLLSHVKVYSPIDTIIYLNSTDNIKFSGVVNFHHSNLFFYPNYYFALPMEHYEMEVIDRKIIYLRHYYNYLDTPNAINRNDNHQLEEAIEKLIFNEKHDSLKYDKIVEFTVDKEGLLLFNTDLMPRKSMRQFKKINNLKVHFDIIQQNNIPIEVKYSAEVDLTKKSVKLLKSSFMYR